MPSLVVIGQQIKEKHKIAHIWERIQAFDQVFKILTVQTCIFCKILILLAASIFVTEGLLIYIYFLLFDENH